MSPGGATKVKAKPGVARPPASERELVDPRIERRRAAVSRGRRRRRTLLVAAPVALVVLAVAGWGILHTSLFSARVVTVRGASHTSVAAITSAAGLTGHPPLVDVNGTAAAQAIEHLPWISSARVSVKWPDGVQIEVRERMAVAAVAIPSGGYAEVDRTGRVLADLEAQPATLPLIDIAGTNPGAPGTTLGPAADQALTVAGSLPKAFATDVRSVGTGPNGVQLTLGSSFTVVLGTTAQLPAKYEDVAAILAGASLQPGDVIDVSVPETPTVSPG